MKKLSVYVALFLTLVILTGSFVRYLGNFLGAAPEFFLMFLVASALSEGPYFGIIAGFIVGLTVDFVSVFIPGANCLIYTTIGYVVGSLRGKFYASSVRNQLILVAVASLLAKAALALAGETFGVRYTVSVKWIVLTIIYDVVLSPLVFYISRKIFGGGER